MTTPHVSSVWGTLPLLHEPLRLLAVCYWIAGSVSALVGLYGFIYLQMGVVLLGMPAQTGLPDPSYGASSVGWYFVALGATFVLGFWLTAVIQILAARWLRAATHRTFCHIAAGVTALFVPLGTLLAVLTFVTLRDSAVRASFETCVSVLRSETSELPNRLP